jgi:hypothetical protein
VLFLFLKFLAKWWNWFTRGTQNAVPQGMRVRISLWPLSSGKWKVESGKLLLQAGWDSVGSHKADLFGSIPKPAICTSFQSAAVRRGEFHVQFSVIQFRTLGIGSQFSTLNSPLSTFN